MASDSLGCSTDTNLFVAVFPSPFISIVASDEKEKKLRAILNFGQTFGHAFERVNNYSKKLSHGEGVLLGMMLASKISFEKKFLKIEDLKLIEKHYENLNLTKNVKK